MRAREDLTNVQFPILNSHPKGEAAIRHPLRMRIEHWELSIGQIPCPAKYSGPLQPEEGVHSGGFTDAEYDRWIGQRN